MNITLVKKEMRESLWKLILGLALLIVTAVSIPLMYEMIRELFSTLNSGELGFLGNFLPTELLDNYSVYVWSQWNGKNLLNIGTLLAVLLGMGMIAGEVNNQTISFLLSRPVSRKSVIISKIVSGALSLGIIVGGSTAVMLILASVSAPGPLDAGRLIVATLITYLGLLLIFILTVFFSVIFEDPVKVAGVTIVALLAMYVLGWFSATRDFAFFPHISAASYFLGGQFPTWSVLVMVVTAILFIAASIHVMEKKEF